MPKYFHPETLEDEECLTAEGERRLEEIKKSYRRDSEKVEAIFEDNADILAATYMKCGEPADLWIEVTDELYVRHAEEAMLQLRNEEGL